MQLPKGAAWVSIYRRVPDIVLQTKENRMATVTPVTAQERKALKAARRLFPDVPKIEVATRFKKAARLGRGRPSADLAGLPPLTKRVDMTRSVGSMARAM